MNNLMLVVLAVVALCYFGGGIYCPKVLSSNKEMLLGVLVGLALCSFAGLKLEGYTAACNDACQRFRDMGRGKTPNCNMVPDPLPGQMGASLTPKLCLPDNLKDQGMDDEQYCGRVPTNCS